MISKLEYHSDRFAPATVALSFKLPAVDSSPKPSIQAASLRHSREISFQSKPMRHAFYVARQYAANKASVLITGESGTGKELFSRLIHLESPRNEQPFVAVNCAALSESLIESELFGHRKGAFTGAIEQREGHFKQADGGTLMLDEISEIPIHLQAKLLRAIEEQEIQPVGSNQVHSVDVRIVATSNRDLPQEIKDGRFRADLFHRLAVLELELPALRDRVADIPLLVMHFAKQFASEYDQAVPRISDQVMQRLCRYQWPGNVRELRNVLHRACVLSGQAEITEACLPPRLLAEPSQTEEQALYGRTLAEVEKQLILRSLENHSGNKSQAAQELGVTARTLSNKLKQYEQENR